jgi:hypothetical protein
MLLAKELVLTDHIFQLVMMIPARRYINCGILRSEVYENWNDNVWITAGFVMRDIEFIDS